MEEADSSDLSVRADLSRTHPSEGSAHISGDREVSSAFITC